MVALAVDDARALPLRSADADDDLDPVNAFSAPEAAVNASSTRGTLVRSRSMFFVASAVTTPGLGPVNSVGWAMSSCSDQKSS